MATDRVAGVVRGLVGGTVIMAASLVAALVLCFVDVGTVSPAPVAISSSGAYHSQLRLSFQCPSIAEQLFGGTPQVGSGRPFGLALDHPCARASTTRALVALVVVAVGVACLGAALLWALCWSLRRMAAGTRAAPSEAGDLSGRAHGDER